MSVITIQDDDLFKAVNIVADFAGWDTTVRLNHSLRAYCNYDDSGFLSYETMLGKTMNIISGFTSSLSYMHLSIFQIIHQDLNEQLEKEGYTEYTLYRYHYIVFSHSIALLQDLMFKLVSVVYSLNVTNTMIGWDKYNALDNYYMSNLWTNLLTGDDKIKNMHPEYIKGSNENVKLLKETKEDFINELKQLTFDAESYVISLCDLCFPKLLELVDVEFYKKHRDDLKKQNNKSLNNHLEKLGL